MLSEEYTKLQEGYVGIDAIFTTKTKSLLQVELEDFVVISKSPLLFHIR